MNIVLTPAVMTLLDIEFEPVNYESEANYFVIPEDHLPDYSDVGAIGSGLIPWRFGRWEDVQCYEGQLMTEIEHDWSPGVTRFEQDCYDNAIDDDDLQKGPDPWGTDTYEDVIINAMKTQDLFYAGRD